MFSVTLHCKTADELHQAVELMKKITPFLASKLKEGDAQAAEAAPAAESKGKGKGKQPSVEEKPNADETTFEQQKDGAASDGTVYDTVREATLKVAAIPGKGPTLIREVLAAFKTDHAQKLKRKEWKTYVEKCESKIAEHESQANLA